MEKSEIERIIINNSNKALVDYLDEIFYKVGFLSFSDKDIESMYIELEGLDFKEEYDYIKVKGKIKIVLDISKRFISKVNNDEGASRSEYAKFVDVLTNWKKERFSEKVEKYINKRLEAYGITIGLRLDSEEIYGTDTKTMKKWNTSGELDKEVSGYIVVPYNIVNVSDISSLYQ